MICKIFRCYKLEKEVSCIKYPPRCIAYAPQQQFKEAFQRLQMQQIIIPLWVDESSEWCNSFVLVLKARGKVQLCFDPARPNLLLIRPMHREPIPILIQVKCLLLNAWQQMSYLTMFTCQFGRHRYLKLLFGAAQASDMFQRIIDQIFRELPNVFRKADDILVVRYLDNSTDHNQAIHGVLQMCSRKGKPQVNWKRPFHVHKHPCFFTKKDLQPFVGIMNYTMKFSPATAKHASHSTS